MSLPKLQGKQAEVLCLPEKGHFVVLGTAGSGKTIMAIYRSITLAESIVSEKQKVMLVTYNRSLVTYLKHLSEGMIKNVDVRNYHEFARYYLEQRGLLGYHDIVPETGNSTDNKKFTFIKEAINNVLQEVGYNSTLERAPEVFYEEIDWMQKMGITTLQDYMEAERIGRLGTRITRDKRKYFFEVYKKYVEIRAEHEYRYDWDDIAQTVIKEYENDITQRMYKHIVIDEGQDFSPVMLRSLVLAIPQDGSITFFGDVAQQIYGGRISWRNAGFNIKKGDVWRFDQNYRNSIEIAQLAIAISNLPCFGQSADIVVPRSAMASGPKPVLAEFENEDNELYWITNNAHLLSKNETVAILVRTRQDVDKIIGLLNKKRVKYQVLHGKMKNWNNNPGISVGTYHSAKGIEFDTVLLPYCSKDRIPDPNKVIALDDKNEALGEEAKLIYVAVTRAKRRLILTYTGEATEILPTDNALYHKTEIIIKRL